MAERVLKVMFLSCLWPAALAAIALVHSAFAGEPTSGANTTSGRGMQAVVRLYPQWRFEPYKFHQRRLLLEEPETFKKITVPVRNLSLVTLDPNAPSLTGIDESTAIVIIADDQTDPFIKDCLGDMIYGRPYKRGLSVPLSGAGYDPNRLWTFTDALGIPIPFAKVTIFLSDYRKANKARIRDVILDNQGSLNAPCTTDDLRQVYLIISHPDYGIAALDADQPPPRTTLSTQGSILPVRGRIFRIPLVKAGTKPDERSIWGVVLNDKGKPVPAAVIRCYQVQTLGGGLIRAEPSMMQCAVITNELGQFSVHLPVEASTTEKTAIPPTAKYHISVEAPKALDLLPYSGLVPCGQETTITLERGGYFRTFAFEGANGPITDAKLLEETFIHIDRPDKNQLLLHPSDWKNGKFLPIGTFSVKFYDENKLQFESVEVTAASPQCIVFKIKYKQVDSITYQGQTVHGITGHPMPGVFILAAGFYEGDFSAITPDQWQQLNQLEVNPLPDDPALEPVHEVIPFNRVVRTGPDGRFEIDINRTEKFDHILQLRQDRYVNTFTCQYLMAFYENYLAVRYALNEYMPFEPNLNTRIELPVIRLYPAARLIFEPNVEERNCELFLSWHLAQDNQPDWTKVFFAFSNKSTYPFVIIKDRAPNMVCSLQIPAEMNLQIRLQIIQYPKGWWCPIYTERINAAQGQTVELGRITVGPQIPIYVKVIDSAGNPIEGLSVAHGAADGKTWFGQREITDPNGVAKFFVPLHYKAAFLVGWHGYNTKTPWQSLTYETKGLQDANSVLTMQLSDEVFQQLFKESKPQ